MPVRPKGLGGCNVPQPVIISASRCANALAPIRIVMLMLAASLLLSLANLDFVRADDRKTASELIRSRGFNVDEFDVVSDNYDLKVYRIINPLADPASLHKVPVIAHHGISWDITNMMAASRNARPRKPKVNERVTLHAMENGTDDRGLYFYLSNNNYDVWMIEARATNERNRRRIKHGGNKKSFWDFSIDEQALIDLPAQTEFVLKRTGAKKFAYIAYSQSTTMMFALLSMRPDFADKVACFVALAPVVFTSHLRGMVWPASIMRIYLYYTSARATVPEWFRKAQNFALTYMCSISYIKQTLCRALWKQFSGPDKNAQLEGGLTENVLKTTSLKSFEQYVNNGMIKDFRMYDYKDEMRNMEEYGQPVPPAYNVSKITLRTIVLFRGTNDFLSDPEDQMILLSRLRVPLLEDHILEDYSHIDFIVSPTIVRDINEPIARVLDKALGRPVQRVSHTLGLNPDLAGASSGEQVTRDARQEARQVSASVRANASGAGLASTSSAAQIMSGQSKDETGGGQAREANSANKPAGVGNRLSSSASQ